MKRLVVNTSLILLAIFLSLGVCFASDDPLTDGINAYKASDYDKALLLLDNAVNSNDRYTKMEQAEGHRYLAMTHLAFGRTDVAREQFVKALIHNPEMTFDPDLTSPKILTTFNEAKALYEARMGKKGDAPPPVDKPEAAGKEHTWRWPAGWALTGTGGASLITSGVFYAMAWDAKSKYDAEDEDQDNLDLYKQQGEQYLIISGVTLGTGLVLTGVGIYFLATEPKHMASIPVGNTHVNLIPSGPFGTWGLSLGGRF